MIGSDRELLLRVNAGHFQVNILHRFLTLFYHDLKLSILLVYMAVCVL
jgi:hypothetical protein